MNLRSLKPKLKLILSSRISSSLSVKVKYGIALSNDRQKCSC